MKKLILYSLVLSLAFALSGCARDKGETTAETTAETTVSETEKEPEKDTEQETESESSDIIGKMATFSIDYADEEFLKDESGYTSFKVEDSEYLTDAVITTDAPVKNLRVVTLEWVDTAENSSTFKVTGELYLQEDFPSDKPFVLSMEFPETIPNIGISYENIGGDTVCLTPHMSGKDGSLLLLDAVFTE